MILTTLVLQNFRSYPKQTFEFSPETTLVIGPNTAGKTNILEAIFMLAIGKSFRADQDRETLRWGEEVGRVNAHVINESKGGDALVGMTFFAHPPNPGTSADFKLKPTEDMAVLKKAHLPASPGLGIKLELVITTGEVAGQRAPLKKYLVNGVPRRMVDFVGNLRAVLFWPEDLELVTDSPSLRRKYLDNVLVQVDREYRRNLLSYERGLRQRNKLLDFINLGRAHRHQLRFWDELLIRAGGYLTDRRTQYLEFINGASSKINHYQLFYDKSVISEGRLAQYKDEEVAAKATLVGPHRDDVIFKLNGNQLSKYGSRGEQRLAVLWLKLAELDFIENQTGERPMLLLDDIFSELDGKHRSLVLEQIGRQQTIVTSADPEVLKLIKKNPRTLVVHLGRQT